MEFKIYILKIFTTMDISLEEHCCWWYFLKMATTISLNPRGHLLMWLWHLFRWGGCPRALPLNLCGPVTSADSIWLPRLGHEGKYSFNLVLTLGISHHAVRKPRQPCGGATAGGRLTPPAWVPASAPGINDRWVYRHSGDSSPQSVNQP